MLEDSPEIVFSEEPHEYRVDGQVIVSVTTALKDLGFIDFSRVPADRLEAARVRGRAVHAALHYWQEGDLDEASVDPRIRPYIDAYALFALETGWKPELLEHLVFSRPYSYAGTLDAVGSMERLGVKEALIDFKSGVKQKATALQTAAYTVAIDKPYIQRFSLQLKNTGQYQLIPYPDYKDIADWKTVIQCWHLRERYRNGDR